MTSAESMATGIAKEICNLFGNKIFTYEINAYTDRETLKNHITILITNNDDVKFNGMLLTGLRGVPVTDKKKFGVQYISKGDQYYMEGMKYSLMNQITRYYFSELPKKVFEMKLALLKMGDVNINIRGEEE